MSDNLVQQKAREWVDSLENRWRLQILSEKTRVNRTTGERKKLPTRIRRFAEGMPWAFVDEAIRYLLSKAPYEGVIYNGVKIRGRYRPTITTWTRDDQMVVNGPGKLDGTYTLVQDLVEMDIKDVYGARSSISCSEEVLTEWHWDEDSLVDLPPPEQGVTYAIVNVGRKEDGTFDYAVVKRRALTQHAGEKTTRDTAVEKIVVDTWDNVYTDEDGRYMDDTGTYLDIPESSSGDGVVVEVSRSENPDCTFKVQAVKTTAKEICVKDMSTETQYDRRKSVSCIGQERPLPPAPPAHDGVVKQHENQLQPDGRYSTEETTSTELPVDHSVVRVTVGRRGKRREVIDRHQDLPANTEGLKVGQSVTVEKTPGHLYDNTVVNFDLSDKTPVAESCEIDLYKHDHSRTIAGVEGIPDEDDHVEGSGVDGFVKTRTTQMDDEGSVSQRNDVHRELRVDKSRETWQVGLRGVRHRVENQHVKTPWPEPEFTRDNIGKTISNERTPGGLYNVVIEGVDRNLDPLQTREGCEKTVFEHTDSRADTDPSGEFTGCVEDAGGGVHRRMQGDLTDDGSVTITRIVTNELPVRWSDVTYKRTAKATISQITDRNVLESAHANCAVGETWSHTTNPGGSRNVTRTVVEVSPEADQARCSTTVFLHSHDNVTSGQGAVDQSCAPAAGGGHYYDKQSTMDDYGIVTTVLRDNDELARPGYQIERRMTRHGLVTRTTDKNVDQAAGVPVKIGGVESHVVTPGGLYDHTTVSIDTTGEPDQAYCSKTVFLHAHDNVSVTADGKVVDAHVEAGGGHYRERRSSVDDYGFVTTIVRDNTELENVKANLGYRNSALEHAESFTDRNVSYQAKDKTDVVNHRIVSTRSARNPGGTYDVTEETRSARPKVLDITYKSVNKERKYKWWVNQDPDTSQLFANEMDPDDSNEVLASVNEFGLEDGHIRSSETGGGRRGDGDKERVPNDWKIDQVISFKRYADDYMDVDSEGVTDIKTWETTMKVHVWFGAWDRYSKMLKALKKAYEYDEVENPHPMIEHKVDRFRDAAGNLLFEVTGQSAPWMESPQWADVTGA